MKLRERGPDPEMKRELDALDAALRGERVDPDLADLAALSEALREARPNVSIEFGAELDAWAAEGFPSAAPARRAKPKRARSRRRLGFVLAPAAATMLAAVVGIAIVTDGGGDDSGDAATGAKGQAGSPTLEQARLGGEAAHDDSGIETAPGTTVAPAPPGSPTDPIKPGQERIQERSAQMTLSTEPDEVDDVADGVVDVVDRYQGIVVSSNVSTEGDRGRAMFDLRIPAQNLQATLADLSDLASVSSRNEGVLDVTAPFITAEERFDEAKAEVDSLISQLAEADSETEAAAIRAELRLARGELAAARAELAGLKQRTDFSRLNVTVVGDGDSDGWSIGDAADDAAGVLEDIAGAGLVALAVIVPLGGLALLAGLGVRQYRRRRRESALDD